MKTSLNWLTHYVHIPWSPRQLAHELTMAGLEVEGIDTRGELAETIVVCRILARAPHPNADKLSVCRVDDGSDTPLQVVCGAPNCDAGQTAVLARIGTQFTPEFTVKKTTLRGVESFGMMCSEAELGVGEDNNGIMILDTEAAPGTPLMHVLGTDTVVDWEVTPNRPDWLSHLGIAREIAALTDAPLTMPDATLDEQPDTNINDSAAVDVLAPELCPRYTARLIRNVTIGPSPDWMQQALLAIGLRPINNVVDITNYVLFECGQPLHAFDFDSLAGGRIVVRRAADGERLRTLDGTEHVLDRSRLLIADAERGVALAGVMGGENSEISDTTTTVLLESAAFQPQNIRATAKALGLASDSSYRFERGVDVEMVGFAGARAAKLICDLAGGTLVAGLINVRTDATAPPPIICRYARINHLLGVDVPPATVSDIFRRLGLEILAADAETCTVAVPSYRLDLRREVDLIEEVARVHGLDRIPVGAVTAVSGGERETDGYYALQDMRHALLALGLTECSCYSMVSRHQALAHTGFDDNELVAISNPLSSEFEILRPTVQPSLLQVAAHNIAHGCCDLRLFELGRVYGRRDGFGEERWEAGIVLSGRKDPHRFSAEKQAVYDFFDLKGRLEDLLEDGRAANVVFRPGTHPAFARGTVALACVDGREVAVCGQVHDALTHDMRLRHPLLMALIQVDALLDAAKRPGKHTSMSQFPAVVRDVAFIADNALTHQQVVEVMRDGAGPLLESVDLFDIYEDPESIGAGRKSMAYSLTFRSLTRTLKDKEVDKAMRRISRRLQDQLPIEYR